MSPFLESLGNLKWGLSSEPQPLLGSKFSPYSLVCCVPMHPSYGEHHVTKGAPLSTILSLCPLICCVSLPCLHYHHVLPNYQTLQTHLSLSSSLHFILQEYHCSGHQWYHFSTSTIIPPYDYYHDFYGYLQDRMSIRKHNMVVFFWHYCGL